MSKYDLTMNLWDGLRARRYAQRRSQEGRRDWRIEEPAKDSDGNDYWKVKENVWGGENACTSYEEICERLLEMLAEREEAHD